MTYIYLVEAIVNDPSIMHGGCYRSQLDNFIVAEIHALNVVKPWLNVAKLVKGGLWCLYKNTWGECFIRVTVLLEHLKSVLVDYIFNKESLRWLISLYNLFLWVICLRGMITLGFIMCLKQLLYTGLLTSNLFPYHLLIKTPKALLQWQI